MSGAQSSVAAVRVRGLYKAKTREGRGCHSVSLLGTIGWQWLGLRWEGLSCVVCLEKLGLASTGCDNPRVSTHCPGPEGSCWETEGRS